MKKMKLRIKSHAKMKKSIRLSLQSLSRNFSPFNGIQLKGWKLLTARKSWPQKRRKLSSSEDQIASSAKASSSEASPWKANRPRNSHSRNPPPASTLSILQAQAKRLKKMVLRPRSEIHSECHLSRSRCQAIPTWLALQRKPDQGKSAVAAPSLACTKS